jgi:hypothetical protein
MMFGWWIYKLLLHESVRLKKYVGDRAEITKNSVALKEKI